MVLCSANFDDLMSKLAMTTEDSNREGTVVSISQVVFQIFLEPYSRFHAMEYFWGQALQRL